MVWNEPGGGKDPWGGNRGNNGPPDIDEALKKLAEKVSIFWRRWQWRKYKRFATNCLGCACDLMGAYGLLSGR